MILEASGLYKSYKSPQGSLPVLKGIDLSIDEGDLVFILGKSGSGKSTLLHLLGLLDESDKGEIIFDGANISEQNEASRCHLRNEKIGFVFQFYHLLPELTLLENVYLPGLIGKQKDCIPKARELLEQVGLIDREGHFPHQLSGGEQQRGALVRALFNEPKLVFCDEPTGNLDEETSDTVIELIQKLNRERNQTFCIVTHDEGFSKKANKLYHLTGGQLHARENSPIKEKI